jgi:hypothetical protein
MGPLGPVSDVSLLYIAGGCLVAAQLLGIYALISRKADLVFSIFMIVLIALAVAFGVVGAYRQIG